MSFSPYSESLYNIIQYKENTQEHVCVVIGEKCIFSVDSSTSANDLVPQECLVICFSLFFLFLSLITCSKTTNQKIFIQREN